MYSYASLSTSGQWTLLGKSNHTTCCLTKVISACPLYGVASRLLVASATDGKLVWWNEPSDIKDDDMKTHDIEWQPLQKVQMHQNAIKDLLILPLASNNINSKTHVIFTVGDDSTLGICRVDSSAHHQPSVSVMLMPRAHAAAITSLALISCTKEVLAHEETQIYHVMLATTGNDQRLKIWKITVNLRCPGSDAFTIAKCANVYTSVADASSILLVPKHAEDSEGNSLMVCGVGIETFAIDDSCSPH